MRNYTLLIIVSALTALSLVSCLAATPAVVQQIPSEVSPTASSLPSRPSPTLTAQATSTRPAPSTPSAIPATLAPPTGTPPPTLAPVEGAKLIKELLATNGNCELPCWWGVRVGQPYQQAEDTFYQMGLPLEANGFQGFLASTPGKELVRDYDVYIQISQTNRMVAAINVWSTNVSEQPHPFTDLWNHYSWSALLGRFGKPSKYRARIMSTPKRIVREGEPYGIFELALNYEHIGLTTRYAYSISLGKKGNPTRVCPRFDQVYDIGLYLYDPNGHEAIDFSDEAYTYKSFNGLTVDEFYAKFTHSDQPQCLSSSP
jgi:hypothetical protein